MNLVDSSGWLEYLADGENAGFFAPAVSDIDSVIVPTICVCEVFKRTFQQRGEGAALRVAGLMRQGVVVELDFSIAVAAAQLGHRFKLPLADSIVLASAHLHAATLWTQDADFEGLDGVRFIKKRRSS